MSRPHLIVFLGPRGAGKSTQMMLLASELRKKGLKVKTSYIKTGIILGFLVASFLVKVFVRKKQNKPPFMVLLEEMPLFFKKTFRLWPILDLIIVTVKFLLGIYVPMKLGYNVLVEDYIPSIITDYIYLAKFINASIKRSSFALSIIFKLMFLSGSPHIIFLNADANMLKNRRLQRGDLDEYQDYLHVQQITLKSFSESFLSHEILCIDTSKNSIKGTRNKIISYLFNSDKRIRNFHC